MTPAESSIVTSMAVVGVSVYGGTIAAGNRPEIRPAVGIVIAGGVLLAATNSPTFAPLAGKLAALMAITAALTSGYYLAAGIGKYLNAPKITATISPTVSE